MNPIKWAIESLKSLKVVWKHLLHKSTAFFVNILNILVDTSNLISFIRSRTRSQAAFKIKLFTQIKSGSFIAASESIHHVSHIGARRSWKWPEIIKYSCWPKEKESWRFIYGNICWDDPRSIPCALYWKTLDLQQGECSIIFTSNLMIKMGMPLPKLKTLSKGPSWRVWEWRSESR